MQDSIYKQEEKGKGHTATVINMIVLLLTLLFAFLPTSVLPLQVAMGTHLPAECHALSYSGPLTECCWLLHSPSGRGESRETSTEA